MDTTPNPTERLVAEAYIELREQGKAAHWPTPKWLGEEGFDDLTSRYMELNETSFEEEEFSARPATPMPEPQYKTTFEETRMFAETYIEAHEQGRIPADWQLPSWLGDPGFEDLTARFVASTNAKIDEEVEEEFPARSPQLHESETEEHPRFSTPAPSEAASNAEEFPTRQSPSRPVSEHLARMDNAIEEDETSLLSNPHVHPAVKAMINSKRAKRDIAQHNITNQMAKAKIQQLYQNLINELDPDLEPEYRELWDEAKAMFEAQWLGWKRDRVVDIYGRCLFGALEMYLGEREGSGDQDRDGEVVGALKGILRLKKGKGVYLGEVEEPTAEVGKWRDMADLVLWEVEEYCWVVGDWDVEVEEEVLRGVRGLLEHLKNSGGEGREDGSERVESS